MLLTDSGRRVHRSEVDATFENAPSHRCQPFDFGDGRGRSLFVVLRQTPRSSVAVGVQLERGLSRTARVPEVAAIRYVAVHATPIGVVTGRQARTTHHAGCDSDIRESSALRAAASRIASSTSSGSGPPVAPSSRLRLFRLVRSPTDAVAQVHPQSPPPSAWRQPASAVPTAVPHPPAIQAGPSRAPSLRQAGTGMPAHCRTPRSPHPVASRHQRAMCPPSMKAMLSRGFTAPSPSPKAVSGLCRTAPTPPAPARVATRRRRRPAPGERWPTPTPPR